MTSKLNDLSPEQRAAFEADMAQAADRFESGEFGGAEPELKDISDLSPERQLAHARYLRAQVAKERTVVDKHTAAAVKTARLKGMSWRKIGQELGVSDEAVRKQYGKRTPADSKTSGKRIAV